MKKALNIIAVSSVFFAIVKNCFGENLIIRQSNPTEGMDVWFGNASGYINPVNDGRIVLGGNGGNEWNSYIRFDLSGLPQAANKAIIWLYKYKVEGVNTTPIRWYEPQSPWQKISINWNYQPNLFLLGDNQNVPANQAEWWWIDITSFYNNWRVGRTDNKLTLNYGLKMSPVYKENKFLIFHGSGSSVSWARPFLYVYYTPQDNDNKIKLKWPLQTPSYQNRVVNQKFGSDWSTGTTCNNLIKKHNGTDFKASSGTPVFAAEDGIVKDVHFDSSGMWAYNIVLEHFHPVSGKYTTVYWHVENISVSAGDFVPKAYYMATVANLGSRTHFHFGIRIGSYDAGISGTGALPQTECGGYPAFPAGFIDPDNVSNVLFQ